MSNHQTFQDVIGCPHHQYIAIIKSAKETSLHLNYTVQNNKPKFAKYYDLHDELYIIGMDNISSAAYIIYDRDYNDRTDPLTEDGKISRIISISDRNEWSKMSMQ